MKADAIIKLVKFDTRIRVHKLSEFVITFKNGFKVVFLKVWTIFLTIVFVAEAGKTSPLTRRESVNGEKKEVNGRLGLASPEISKEVSFFYQH